VRHHLLEDVLGRAVDGQLGAELFAELALVGAVCRGDVDEGVAGGAATEEGSVAPGRLIPHTWLAWRPPLRFAAIHVFFHHL